MWCARNLHCFLRFISENHQHEDAASVETIAVRRRGGYLLIRRYGITVTRFNPHQRPVRGASQHRSIIIRGRMHISYCEIKVLYYDLVHLIDGYV